MFIYSLGEYGWYVARIHPDSFRPSPAPRSMAQFIKKNDTHAIFYGGYREKIAWNTGENIFYNDMYLVDVSNPELIKWTRVNYAPSSPVPNARSYECAVYSEIEDAFFMYGGLLYTSNFSTTIILGDSWVYHFSTNTWTLLDALAPAGYRAGHGCALDSSGENVIVLHGIKDNDTDPINATSIWKLSDNTWTHLPPATVGPLGRWLFGWQRIPGTNNFLMINGRIPSFGLPRNQTYRTDIWALNGDNYQWTELVVTNVQDPPFELSTFALTSSKWLLMSGGDADGNKTVAETCKPPLICRTVVTPQDTNYFLRLNFNSSPQRGDWEDEAEFDHTTTRHRHAAIVLMKPYIYMYGGHDWDGQHGIGEIYNTLLWAIKLPNKYW